MRQLGKLLCVVTLLFASLPNQAEARMFGSNEIESHDITNFTKWKTVVKRHKKQMAIGGDPIDSWKRKAKGFQNLHSKKAKLAAVNNYINGKIKYKNDDKVWGKSDYWATPMESLKKGMGDCDDYAIAKYFTLIQLGFDERDMRVVVLKDKNKNQIHAVLAVFADNNFYILDNQIRDIKPDYQITSYEPIYSINQRSWWRHS